MWAASLKGGASSVHGRAAPGKTWAGLAPAGVCGSARRSPFNGPWGFFWMGCPAAWGVGCGVPGSAWAGTCTVPLPVIGTRTAPVPSPVVPRRSGGARCIAPDLRLCAPPPPTRPTRTHSRQAPIPPPSLRLRVAVRASAPHPLPPSARTLSLSRLAGAHPRREASRVTRRHRRLCTRRQPPCSLWWDPSQDATRRRGGPRAAARRRSHQSGAPAWAQASWLRGSLTGWGKPGAGAVCGRPLTELTTPRRRRNCDAPGLECALALSVAHLNPHHLAVHLSSSISRIYSIYMYIYYIHKKKP